MKSSGRSTSATRPVRTYRETIAGSASVANCAQAGHCRSPNSSSVIGAAGLPSDSPRCGMPASMLSVCALPGTGLPGRSSEVLPEPSTATSTAAAAATVTSSAASW